MSTSFTVGDRVQIRVAYPTRHCRTPYYLRGREGVIETDVGEYRNPEQLAYGGDGLPKKRLYRVRFAQDEIWPDYPGGKIDSLLADIYEHWLEPIQ